MLFLLGNAGSLSAVFAQGTVAQIDWQTQTPEGDEFTVEMPKDPKFEASDEPYHRMTLHTRLLLSARESGPVFAVVSLSGIKSNPAQYSELERTNSYVDAFKNWFPQKVRGKDAAVKLTLVGDKVLYGNPGRDYRMTIGDLSGTARTFVTRKRFYAVVVLNAKKDDAITDRFLSSFTLPERILEATASAPPAPVTPPDATANPGPAKKEGAEGNPKTDSAPAGGAGEAKTEAKTSDAAPATKPGERGPISGGVLNGKAISLPAPEYPAIAAQAGASGTVTVQVMIDEAGNVISARAISGHPLLQAAAVSAAQQARFSPTSLMGEPVKVTGVLTYNFVSR